MMLGTGIIGGLKDATVVFGDTAATVSNGSSYSFTGRNLGAANAKRTIIVYGTYSFLVSGSITGFTLDGTPMNARTPALGGAFLYTLPWSTGTTGTFAVTGSSVFSAMGFSIWAAYDLKSEVPTATAGASFGSSPRSTSINVQKGGIVVGIAVGPNNGNFSWTGLTKDTEFLYNPGSVKQSPGSGAFAAAQSPLSVQTTYGGNHSAQVAAFR